MKNLLLIIIICYCNYLSAQKRPPLAIEDKKMDAYLIGRKPASLTIQLKNLPDSIKKVTIKYVLVQFGGTFQTTKYTETDAAGRSTIILSQNLPYQQIWLSVADYLYAGLYINTALTVTIDVNKLSKDGIFMIGDGVTYTGYDGELNTVMNRDVVFRQKEKENLFNNLRILCNSRKEYTVNSFTFKTDSILKILTSIDSAFISKFPSYGWAIKNETLSQFYENISTAYYSDKMPDKFFKEVNAHKPLFTSNDGVEYFDYLGNYNISKKHFKKEDMLKETVKLFDSLYTQQRSDILKLYLLESEKDNYARSYPLIINSIKTKWCKRIATDELTKANANKKKIDSIFALSTKLKTADIGIPIMHLPFNADLYKIDPLANVDEFIRSISLKFPKKAIIIDFWATWCGPCLADLPYSKRLHEQNKDLPIEYIYLCTTSGSNMELWKNKIGDLQIPGTHIFVNDKIITKLKTAFNSDGGFPTYVVIDLNGKVNQKRITQMGVLDRDGIKKIVGL